MTEASVSFAGNLTDHPELRHTEGGIAWAMFRVAVSARRDRGALVLHRDRVARPGRACRRVPDQGQRVVVMGRLQQRTWTAGDGSARSVVEVVADELGPEPAGRRRRRPRRPARPLDIPATAGP
jgi:single-strand DNA-binding protein